MNLRERFAENAEQFDSLVTEMFAENDALRARAERLEWLLNEAREWMVEMDHNLDLRQRIDASLSDHAEGEQL